MTKTIIITTFIFPWEIDDLERISISLKEASFYSSDCKYIWSVTMDLSDNRIDWNNSKLPKELFESKFNAIKRFCNWCEIDFDTNESLNCFGAADKKRNCIEKYHDKCDAYLWLDTDIFFPKHILSCISSTISQIQEDHYIVTPEIIKYWDSSWDNITNKKFLKEPFNHRDYFDMFSLDSISPELGDPVVETINEFKFGAGWFTCVSSKLAELATIPKFIADYGPDDTWLMYFCMEFNRRRSDKIKQYVIRNVVVTENGKTYIVENYYKNFLDIKEFDIETKKRNIWNVFGQELKKQLDLVK